MEGDALYVHFMKGGSLLWKSLIEDYMLVQISAASVALMRLWLPMSSQDSDSHMKAHAGRRDRSMRSLDNYIDSRLSAFLPWNSSHAGSHCIFTQARSVQILFNSTSLPQFYARLSQTILSQTIHHPRHLHHHSNIQTFSTNTNRSHSTVQHYGT